jgi:hypothetical protein
MSTPSTTSEYALLIKNPGWHMSLSGEEVQKCMDRFNAWGEELAREGKIKGGTCLAHEGKIVESQKIVTDGPFAESKEVIAGFIIIQAASFQEAVEIAQSAPCLEYGQTIEVRPISPEAPETWIARERIARHNA